MKPHAIGLLVLLLSTHAAAQDKSKPTRAKAVAAIKKLGGRVTVDGKRPGKPVTGVDLDDTKLKELWLDKTRVTAAGVKTLQAALPKCTIVR